MADAKPQAIKIILITELGDDVAQPVMSAVPAPQFEFGDAGGHVEFVVGHQNGFRRDAEEIRQCRYGLAAAIHKGGGDQQANIAALMAEFANQAKILFFEAQVDALAVSQALNEKGSCIMPSLVVFRAGVTQANDQLYGSHVRSPFVEIARQNRIPSWFPTLRGLLGSAFVFSNAGGVDVSHCQVVTVSQCNQLNAFRQFQVGQVNDLTHFNGSHVDFDEFR